MTTRPTDDDLAQWKRLAEEATPGPWDAEYGDDTVKLVHHNAPGTFTITVTGLPDDMRWSAGMTVSIEETP